ncbi:MAG TPA: alkaline phosphatase family protein [Candidatus Dormibacteraeota bacterium]
MHRGRTSALVAIAGVAVAAFGAAGAAPAVIAASSTSTPVKHLVVIFQENVSFDHYFGTYPKAANPPSQPRFTANEDTPHVAGLSHTLLTANPNLGNPQRLDRTQPLTCDQGHDYTPEQNAVDHGAMDKFVQNTGAGLTLAQCLAAEYGTSFPATPGNYAVMDYYDGNTVTALWNYAQRFAMSDRSFGTTYGPSTPGALNVTAANTAVATCGASAAAGLVSGGDSNIYDANGNVLPCPGGVSTAAPPGSGQGHGTGTVVSDPDQYFDACSNPKVTAALTGRNIGDELTAQGITWGWFNGGFSSPGYVPGQPQTFNAATICKGKHYNIGAGAANDGQPCTLNGGPLDRWCVTDYSAHHEPFQYYASTSNPTHMPPSSVALIGTNSDGANHQYDLADFWAAANSGHLPAVSYLKAPKFQDGHAGYSDPLDEQHFLADTLNKVQHLPDWRSTAVVVAYDDSDGWYDHLLSPVRTSSSTPLDTLTGLNSCSGEDAGFPGQQARCGLGPRLPLLVISPFARRDYVDHHVTEQASVVRFIEDNWHLSRLGGGAVDASAGSLAHLLDYDSPHFGRLILDPTTGLRV